MEHREDVTRFTAVDQQADPGFFISFLDAGNALEDIKSVKRVMLSQLELHDGMSLLDTGCGTGDDVWDLARVVGPRGRMVGVDVSGAMIAEAKKRHALSGLPVEFVEGDAQNLTFPDASFDRCRTERMLMHLDDPEKALAEMVRVVRPSGKVVVFDFDWDAVFVDSPYKGTTRKIVHAFCDGIKHGWIGRSLPRMFHAAGLTEVTCVPHTVRPHYAFAHRLFDGHLAKAQQAGVLSADELARWWSTSSRPKQLVSFTSGSSGSSLAAGNPELS
jgi:ubiquinone/menaquinone biosynthesis C-methylase UbiE